MDLNRKEFDYGAIKRARQEFEAERQKLLKNRIYRAFTGVQISDDYGKTWRSFGICDECLKTIEPPRQRRKCGASGVFTCDWCDALNEIYRK